MYNMENNNAINFKGLYYAKSAIFASEIKAGVKPYLIDPHPNKLLQDVVENSPIFKDLKGKTDVYVSSYISSEEETSNKYTRYIRAIFKDPYRKQGKRIDTINLQATGEDETAIFQKLKNIASELPIYKNFKYQKFVPGLQILELGENGSEGFIQRNVKF